MTDLSLNGTADEGHDHNPLPRFSTAEDVNPPLPGDPGYEDYVERCALWMRWLDQERAYTPGVHLVSTPYYDAGLGRMVTPEDPPPVAEPSVGATSSGGGGADAPITFDDISPGQDRPWQRTDAANGELFAQLHGDRVRYDHRRGHWLLWGGDWWRPDEIGEVRILAKEAARLRYEEATRIEDLARRAQEAGFATAARTATASRHAGPGPLGVTHRRCRGQLGLRPLAVRRLLIIASLSGPAIAAKASVERFLGPEAVGWCDTLVTEGDRVKVGHARVRYTNDGQVEVRLNMRNLAPNQLHRVLLHQQGDPYDPGLCNFSDVHHVTSDGKGRIMDTLSEPAVGSSDGMFVTVYAADVTTDPAAFSTYPIFGTAAVYAD